MKKSNLIKVFSILAIVSLMLVVCATTVRAADDDGFTNMGLLSGNNTSASGNTSSGNTSGNTSGNNTSGNNSASNNSSSNSSRNNTSNSNRNNTINNAYSNANLPNTGIGSSIPVAMLIVIFAISSVYAYKKINDYRNI